MNRFLLLLLVFVGCCGQDVVRASGRYDIARPVKPLVPRGDDVLARMDLDLAAQLHPHWGSRFKIAEVTCELIAPGPEAIHQYVVRFEDTKATSMYRRFWLWGGKAFVETPAGYVDLKDKPIADPRAELLREFRGMTEAEAYPKPWRVVPE